MAIRVGTTAHDQGGIRASSNAHESWDTGFVQNPFVSATTNNSIELQGTLEASGDVYAVALLVGKAIPSAAQIKAGTDGDDVAAAATASDSSVTAFTVSLTETNFEDHPIYDVYIVGEIAAVFTDARTIENVLLPAPSGSERIVVSGVPWPTECWSVFESASPAVVNGDILEYDSVSTNGGFSVNMNSNGTFSLGSGDDYSQETFDYGVYRVATNTWATNTTTLLSQIESEPASPSKVKYWNGSAWVAGVLRIHDGNTWTGSSIKYYDTNSSTWENVNA